MKRDYKTILTDLWKLIEDGATIMCNEDKRVIFHSDHKSNFQEIFKHEYEHIADNYMEHPQEPLDRHKVAAIIIVSIIKSEIITGAKEAELVFYGNYILATDTALLYMLNEINKRLELKKCNTISEYFFPEAMSCKTDYYVIFYRNLYFAHTDELWQLNTLAIAERLFLLEYMSLDKNGIDPSILKEYE